MKALNKLTSVVILSACVSHSAVAADFPCKAVFDRKIERLEKTHGIRKVGRTALYTVGGVAGMGALFFGAASGALTLTGVAFFGGLFGVPTGLSLGSMLDAPVETQIRNAYEAQLLMDKSHEELLREAEETRAQAVEIAVREFDARVTHPEYARKLVTELNDERLKAGLPLLQPAEAIAALRENLRAKMMSEEIRIENVIMNAMDKLKSKQWISNEITYDQFRMKLIENSEKFCPNNEAQKFKSVLKDIFKQ